MWCCVAGHGRPQTQIKVFWLLGFILFFLSGFAEKVIQKLFARLTHDGTQAALERGNVLDLPPLAFLETVGCWEKRACLRRFLGHLLHLSTRQFYFRNIELDEDNDWEKAKRLLVTNKNIVNKQLAFFRGSASVGL
jgi:hypothetical protein